MGRRLRSARMKPVTWKDSISDYMAAIRVAGYSTGTLRGRWYHLQRISELAPTPDTLAARDLIAYADAHEWSAETRRSFFSSAKAFYKWAVKAGIVAHDPTEELVPVKVPLTVGNPPKDIVIIRAIEKSESRERLMIRIAAMLGLRVCEIAIIHEKDWDGQELIVHGKGKKDRILPVTDLHLRMALNRMEGYLFPGRIDGHISAGYVSKLISRALPDGVTAHKLRHRFATASYRETDDLLAVSEALGHTKSSTTQRYIGRSKRRLLAAVKGAQLEAA